MVNLVLDSFGSKAFEVIFYAVVSVSFVLGEPIQVAQGFVFLQLSVPREKAYVLSSEKERGLLFLPWVRLLLELDSV